MTDKPITAPIHVMDFERRNQAYEQGSKFAEVSLSKDELGRQAALTLGTNPTFEEWTEYAREWKDGYLHARPGVTPDAADQAFSRNFTKLVQEHGVTKPESKGVHAEKKREQRAAAADKLMQEYAGKTAAELRDMRARALTVAASQGAGSVEAEKLADKLKKVIKAVTSEENKIHGEQLKELRAQVRAAAGKCIDLDKLQAALDCLDDAAEINFIIEGDNNE